MVPEFDRLRELLASWLRDNPHVIPADGEGRATVIAKAIAESSRDEVYTVRALRYELERVVGANLRRLRTQELEFVLADVVELTVAVSRARDEATEAYRGGLTSWRSDPAAYHAQRRLQDPTLPTVGGVLIGIPALIIALYGATSVLPIDTSNLVVLLPVAAAGVMAGLLAAFLPGRERVGKFGRFSATLVATAATIVLLASAGALVTPQG